MVGKLLSFLGLCFFRGYDNFGSVISLLYKYKLSQGDVCYQDRPWNFCDAQFGILSFRSKGDEDLRILGPIQLSEKEAKKSLNCPPKKHIPANPLPFLDKGTHWSFQQSLSRPWSCPFFRILASLKKGVRSSAGDKTNSSDLICESKKNIMQAV